MHINIYFNNKKIILCDTPESIKQQSEDIILENPDNIALQSLIAKTEETDFTSGIVIDKNFSSLQKKFFQQFTAIEAAGGVVENEDQEILFIYRLGKWDLPKGKMEDNEASSTCALREVEEETGLLGLTLKNKIGETYHTYKAYGNYFLKTTHWYHIICSKDQPLQPQTEENIEKAIWVTRQNLQEVMANTYPSIQEVLDRFFQKP